MSPEKKTAVTSKKTDRSHTTSVTPATPVTRVPTPPVPTLPNPQLREQREYVPAAPVPETEKPVARDGSTARLAIIIDDMGSSLSEARSLAAIKVPLTFAIIPGLRSDKGVASFAASNSIETMIHIPMQSKGWPAQRLEANGLLVAMDAGQLQERVSAFIQQFPGAVGANNHMGSEFTEREELMTVVLKILHKHDLFFIDSVTSPGSCGARVAQQLGMRTARRQVFLDNEQNGVYIRGQLNQAIRLARKNGSAIAICHPHPATIAALSAALPELAGQGIQLVPVSQLVK
ncbi:MAG: divergent polysaccharide deacetylase family protein [Desulfuromonadaceae bacterium]|nr:divergent polysaccharide deacetylase family protein [Desulfuromonadaceae bacterium]